MAIKIVWTHAGQIIGDVKETHEGLAVENPVFLSPGPQGVSMLPVLMFTDQKTLTLTDEDLRFNGEQFEPLTELRNAYSQQFGSGIQLLNG